MNRRPLYSRSGKLRTEGRSPWIAPDGISPVYAEAHSNLANVYAGRGRLDAARAELEQALRINPAFPEAHMATTLMHGPWKSCSTMSVVIGVDGISCM